MCRCYAKPQSRCTLSNRREQNWRNQNSVVAELPRKQSSSRVVIEHHWDDCRQRKPCVIAKATQTLTQESRMLSQSRDTLRLLFQDLQCFADRRGCGCCLCVCFFVG